MKKNSTNLQAGLLVEIRERGTTVQVEAFGPPFGRFRNQTAGMFSGSKPLGCLLVVDDDPAIRLLNRLILENEGYDILEAEDGQEAIKVLRRGEFGMVVELIITDLNMPKVDGFESIAMFQQEYPSIPVIVLTGIDDREVKISFMRRGVSDYLEKPVDARTLIASVAHAINNDNYYGFSGDFKRTPHCDSHDVCVIHPSSTHKGDLQ